MKQVTPGIRDAFVLVEQVLQETFLPALFQSLGERTPGRGVTRLHVKQAGLALPDPTKTAPDNWTASYTITVHLFAVIRGQEEFRSEDHSTCLQEGRMAVRKRIVLLAEDSQLDNLAGALVQGAR